MFAEWCTEAQKIVEQTGDAHAADVLNFLLFHTILAEPKSDGTFCTLEDSVTPTWVACLPLLSEDAMLCEAWQRELHQGFGVSFRPDCRTMILKGNVAFTPQWKGILLLHEGDHATTFTREPYNWHNARIYVSRERDTHAFQNRLVWLIGGREYQDRVEGEAERLVHTDRWTWDEGWPTGLDRIFGAAASEKEYGIRFAHWMVHTGFRACERVSETDDEMQNRQTSFLYEVYHQHGILDGKDP